MTALGLIVLGFVALLATGVPVAVAIGVAAIAGLYHTGMPLSWVAQTAYSAVNSFTLIAVPMFILAGALMEKGGMTVRLITFARLLVGRAPGGLAAVTIVACTLFAAISGSGPATTAAIGSIMIPAMLRDGYKRGFASGLTASAGGIGVVIPPSIPMIIYGITAETSITALFLAGIIPGLMIAVAIYVPAAIISKIRGYASHGDVRNMRALSRAAWDAKWSLFAPVIILGGIYSGAFTVTEASVVAVVYALLVGVFIHREIDLSALVGSLVYAARIAGTVMFVLATGRMLGRYLTIEQVPQMVSNFMLNAVESPVILIALIVLLLIFVGMWMETITQIILLTPLLLPVATGVGLHPIQFGIMFVIACEIGYQTPPLGVNLFVASEISGSSFEEVSKGALPFCATEIVVLFMVAFIPSLTLWLPRTLGFIS